MKTASKTTPLLHPALLNLPNTMHLFRWLGILSACFSLALHAPPLEIQNGQILRDAELEDTLRLFINPLLKKAGISPGSVQVLILSNRTLNAFATFGPLIVVHTGLLTRCKRVEELLGVLAHEIGHVKKAHLPPRLSAMNQSYLNMLAMTGLGAVISLLTGHPAGLLLGSSLGAQVGSRTFLSFNRSQEIEADLVASDLLHQCAWPSDGLASLFQRLQENTLGTMDAQDAYQHTHPLPKERIQLASRRQKKGFQTPKRLEESFRRMQTKLWAYAAPPNAHSDFSLPEKQENLYMHAVQSYRSGHLDQSKKLFQQLLQTEPTNPYIYEMLAETSMHQGQWTQGLRYAEKAIQHSAAPHTLLQLLKVQCLLARLNRPSSQIQSQEKSALSETIQKILDAVVSKEPFNSQAWYYLGILAAKNNQKGRARFYLAEYHLCQGHYDLALSHAQQAKKILNKNSAFYRRADDLEHMLKQEKQN